MLKMILPNNCLWTSLRTVEGLDYDQTMEQLKTLFPSEDEDMEDAGDHVLPASVPESIREMSSYPKAIESLGCMIWSVI
jgi:DNA mismatch repair protein MSH6